MSSITVLYTDVLHLISAISDFLFVSSSHHVDPQSQSFPCIRVIQPGEFSLGVHCDSNYGFAPCNLNVVVPLTPNTTDIGASALYAESAPMREDWHAVVPPDGRGEGRAVRFWGCAIHPWYYKFEFFNLPAIAHGSLPCLRCRSQCLHWTSENTSQLTRVSLDFRIVTAAAWHACERVDAFDSFSCKRGFVLRILSSLLEHWVVRFRHSCCNPPPGITSVPADKQTACGCATRPN